MQQLEHTPAPFHQILPPLAQCKGWMQFKVQHNAWVSYKKSQANTHGTTKGCCINHTSDCLAGPCTCRQEGGGCPNLMINPHLLNKLLLNEWLRVQIMVMHPICTCSCVQDKMDTLWFIVHWNDMSNQTQTGSSSCWACVLVFCCYIVDPLSTCRDKVKAVLPAACVEEDSI